MNEYTITMTSKGQFTMPVKLREIFGLKKAGDQLNIKYDSVTRQAKIQRPLTAKDVQARARRHLKPGIAPLVDARAFYNTRAPRI
jgi:bifunctional DNA-binding transcriptional regulator/antitoxin component of YhaV-PrlF toxin-antitoxin module